MGDASLSFPLVSPARDVPRRPDTRQLHQIHEEVTNHYLRHRDAVFRFLLTNSRKPAEAEDLAHEAFLRLYVHCAAGELIESPLAWLLTVARNMLIDRGRQSRREVPQGPDVWALLTRTCGDSAPNAEKVLITEDRSAAIRRALGQLQGPEKDCLSLRLKGFTFREIADALEISMSSAVTHTNRAIGKVRRWVNA